MRILLLSIAIAMQPAALGPLTSELARLQDAGQVLVTVNRGVATSDFSRRSFESRPLVVERGVPQQGLVSRDGKDAAFELSVDNPYRRFLAIAHIDGTALQTFESIRSPSYLCWSDDKSKVAMAASNDKRERRLLLLNVMTKTMETFAAEKAYLTSQCWSPDGKQIVYGVGDRLWIYDLQEQKSRELGKGADPAWSPDGNWIAYRDGDTFYAVRPTGKERKTLFTAKNVRSGLTWSPDATLVAYERLAGHYVKDTDFVARQVVVHRLADNAEAQIAEEADVAYVPSFQWIQPSGRP